jgi:outer membrane protein assembly factor BamD (BamD/ComL family)
MAAFAAVLLSVAATDAGAAPYEVTARKHSWFSFIKPHERTPEAQLERAERFASRGWLKNAQDAYRALVITWPASTNAGRAQMGYAQMLDDRGRLEEACAAYDELLDRYNGDRIYTNIVQRQFEIAKTVMGRRKLILIFGGFRAPEKAIPLFESVVRHAPTSTEAPEAQFLIGECNELIDEYELAVVAYMNTQHRYPDSSFAIKAAYARTRCLFQMSMDRRNDEEALEEAWAATVAFQNAYPTSDYDEEIKANRESLLRRRTLMAYKRAEFYDRIARRPQAALACYRQFIAMYPSSDLSQTARIRIERLEPMVKAKEQGATHEKI